MTEGHYQSCIEACSACAVACSHCAASCLNEENVADMRECIRLDLDCADICMLSVEYMARGSNFAVDVCALCGDVCEACADECARHDSEHCRACAEACKRCADECRRMRVAA